MQEVGRLKVTVENFPAGLSVVELSSWLDRLKARKPKLENRLRVFDLMLGFDFSF